MSIQWLRNLLLLIVLAHLAGAGENRIPVNMKKSSNLMVKMSEILCIAKVKVIFVYFENQTSHEHTGQILREVTKCDISYISLRYDINFLEIHIKSIYDWYIRNT